MVTFYFYDKEGTLIPNIDASNDIPEKVARMEIHGPYNRLSSSYKCLTTMLKSSRSKKIREIKVVGLSAEESPEFLAFLVLICNKTNSLRLRGCPLSSNATSCLMGSLLLHDGISHLEFSWVEPSPMPTNQAKILLEGVASSPCLEIFDLQVPEFTDRLDVYKCLLQALRRNQRLKKISLITTGFNDKEFHNILKASILGKNVKAVSITDDLRELRLGVLEEALCHKDCTLEKLQLHGVRTSMTPGWEGSIIQNVSVKSLKVSNTTCGCDELTRIISLFKSLVELDLSENRISQLSFLDPLLFGETSKLKSLDVTCNRIDEEEMELFIQKLRNNRGLKLKHLEVEVNDWENLIRNSEDATKTALVNVLRDNTNLEFVDFASQDLLPLDLNRGGRRAFESQPSEPFPTNLLPRVLKRASSISYYDEESDEWGRPTNKKARADVVFWMIHRIVPQLQN